MKPHKLQRDEWMTRSDRLISLFTPKLRLRFENNRSTTTKIAACKSPLLPYNRMGSRTAEALGSWAHGTAMRISQATPMTSDVALQVVRVRPHTSVARTPAVPQERSACSDVAREKTRCHDPDSKHPKDQQPRPKTTTTTTITTPRPPQTQQKV